ncbi:MAG TPA: hypothetical protein VGA50_17050 [Kiloniellales bacterium]
MIANRLTRLAAVVAGLALSIQLVPLCAGEAQAQGYESPPSFAAADVLPPEILKGPHYTVQQTVENDGVLNRYRVETPQGLLTVDSTDRLMIRLQEVEALQRMEDVKRSEVFKEAFKASLKAPVELAEGLVTAPVETVAQVGKGVGTFFSSVGHSLFGGASEEEESAVETAVGYDVIKRQFAFQFGVDPYTHNELVQERLTELSRAAFLGGLPTKVALAAIPGTATTVLRATSFSEGMRKLLLEKSPAELKEINAAKLKDMQVDDSVAGLFLEHPHYSPSKKTYIAAALEQMKGVAGRGEFIRQAALAPDEPMAFFLQQQAQAMAAYHLNVAPVAVVIGFHNRAFMQRADGTLVGVFPVDHIVLRKITAQNASGIGREIDQSLGKVPRELWLTGTASPLFRETLQAEGWQITEKAKDRLTLP